MPNKTTNYNLIKSTLNETADIEVINNNMDILDKVIKEVDNKTSEHKKDTSIHVTQTEKTTWNGKQDNLGFTPENITNKGKVNGYASLGSDGKIPSTQLPKIESGAWEKIAVLPVNDAMATTMIFQNLPSNCKVFKCFLFLDIRTDYVGFCNIELSINDSATINIFTNLNSPTYVEINISNTGKMVYVKDIYSNKIYSYNINALITKLTFKKTNTDNSRPVTLLETSKIELWGGFK